MESEDARDIGKIWGALRELKAWAEGKVREFEILILGPDKGNGLRGDMKALHSDHAETKERIEAVARDVAEARAWGQRLWEVERHQPGNCLGRVAVQDLRDELDSEAEERRVERTEMRRTRMMMLTSIIVAALTALASVVVAIINAGGKP